MEIGAAAVDFENLCRHAVENVTVVSDEQQTTRECGESVFEIGDRVEVEMVGGFVENEGVPLATQQRSEGNTFRLATRQPVGAGVEHVAHAEPRECSLGSPGFDVDAGGVTHGASRQDGVLRQNANACVATGAYLAGVGLQFAGENAQKRAFPAAVEPDDADTVARRHGDREVAEERAVGSRCRKALCVDHDHGFEDTRTPIAYARGVGFFAKRRERKILEQQQAAEREAAASAAKRQEQLDLLDTMIDAVERSARGDLDGLFEGDDGSLVLKAGEFAIARIQNSGLLETTRAPATYQGGYGGVSFPLFGGIRLNTGGVRGKRVPGEESLSYIEEGDTVITNRRAVFLGAKNTVEWPFAKVIACEHNEAGYSTFGVSGRKKNSGFAYGSDVADQVQFRIEWGIALCNETTDQLLVQLRAERAHLTAG